MEQQQQTLPALNSDTIKVVMERNLPKMKKRHDVALALLNTIEDPKNDEDAEDITAKLAGVRDVYNVNMEDRKQITSDIDKIKDQLMEFERPFDPKSDKSIYSQKRKLLEVYQQTKLDNVRKEQAVAAKRKEIENHKVDLKAKILENLTTMIVTVVKRVDQGSKDYFEALTLDIFDAKAEAYKNNRPKLKPSDYETCFTTVTSNILSPDEYKEFISSVAKDETSEKWNATFVEAVAPVINQWRARIPDLKQQKNEQAIAAGKSEEEAKKLAEDQKKKNDEEFAERQRKLDAIAEESKKQIQSDANLDKMSNNFAAQASIQQLDDAGGVKLVAKFTDVKLIQKAFVNIVYLVMATDNFGIQKRDPKTKKLMVDDKNRPVYIEPVQWWLDQYVKDCNAAVEGVTIFEDSKVTIRK